MNLYITSKCPIESAKNLDDKSVLKMLLDSSQIMSTVIMKNSKEEFNLVNYTNIKDKKLKVKYYFHTLNIPSPSRKDHPCVKWSENTHSNYGWVCRYFYKLCDEYRTRYGINHELFNLRKYFLSGSNIIKAGPLTHFVNCAGNSDLNIDYRDLNDTIKAYKLYLCDKWDLAPDTTTWYNIKNKQETK